MDTSDTFQVPQGLRAVSSERRDTEGQLIELDYQYELSNGHIDKAIEYIQQKHGKEVCITPIGGQSAGGGVFTSEKGTEYKTRVGLIITPAIALSERNNIAYTLSDKAPETLLKTHAFHIDTKKRLAYVGAGVVLDQLVATVKEALGSNFQVLGTDLTSSGYATTGATFMTGGMGPTRTNFAQCIQEINYYNGERIVNVSDRYTLDALAETYGWTGVVQNVTLPIIEVPPFEFGFALPINNTPEELSRLVSYFANKTVNPLNSGIENQVFIAGLEIITGTSLALLEKHTPGLKGLDRLLDNCKLAGKDSVVFISGSAVSNPFEDFSDPLGIFVDNSTSGLSLEQATPFSSLRAMKNIREGAPELARRQFLDAPFSYKDHTDINVTINLDNTVESVKQLMSCYQAYKIKLEELIASTDGLKGNVQIYGHINPQGLDPHYRVTIVSAEEDLISHAKKRAKELYNELVRNIRSVSEQTGSKICGGEKGIISNLKILQALRSDAGDIPTELASRLEKQRKAIAEANPLFNWRAKI